MDRSSEKLKQIAESEHCGVSMNGVDLSITNLAKEIDNETVVFLEQLIDEYHRIKSPAN